MSTARILLVEDDPVFHVIVRENLKSGGYELAGVASSGEDALLTGRHQRLDLILMDIALQGEMNGIETVRRLSDEHDVPVIYLTAHSSGKLLKEAQATGPYGFVTKPFSKDQLLSAVRTALTRHQLDRAVRESRSWLLTVLSGMGDAVITTDEHREVTFVNSAAETLLGTTKQRACGGNINGLFNLFDEDGNSRTDSLLKPLLDKLDCPVVAELAVLKTSHDASFYVEVSGYRLTGDLDECLGSAIFLRNVTERKLAEEASRASRQRFVDLFELSHEAILFSFGERITEANQAAAVLFGFSREELFGKACDELFAEREEWEDLRSTLKDHGCVSGFECRMIRNDDSLRWCHISANLRDDEKGNTLECQIVIRDITEERSLLETLKSFKLALDSTQVGVTITDLDGRITYVNQADADMHGYQQDELLGRSAALYGIEGSNQPAPPESTTCWSRQSTNAKKGGTTFPVQLHSDRVTNADGEQVATVTCCQDLTERLNAEQEIRQLYSAIEQGPAMVFITDTRGNIVYVNPQFTRITGFSAEEVLGKNPRVLDSGLMDFEVHKDLWQTISSGGAWRGEFLNRKKDGSLFWSAAAISGVVDDSGTILNYIGIQEDITSRKEMESELAEKNDELERLNRFKSDMVAVTSHDLKSPLNAMISLALLLKETQHADSVVALVDQIIASGRRLTSFISDVLDVEKLESGQIVLCMQHLSLGKTLEACVEITRAEARAEDICVSLQTEGVPGPIEADPDRLTQVFGNLLANAVKFSRSGSEIEVFLSEVDGNNLVAICDRGPGVPEEDLDAIFDRYFQVSRGGKVAERGFGVGLGLYITRQLLELHGGKVWAENRPHGGCRFTVQLPGFRIRDDSGCQR